MLLRLLDLECESSSQIIMVPYVIGRTTRNRETLFQIESVVNDERRKHVKDFHQYARSKHSTWPLRIDGRRCGQQEHGRRNHSLYVIIRKKSFSSAREGVQRHDVTGLPQIIMKVHLNVDHHHHRGGEHPVSLGMPVCHRGALSGVEVAKCHIR